MAMTSFDRFNENKSCNCDTFYYINNASMICQNALFPSVTRTRKFPGRGGTTDWDPGWFGAELQPTYCEHVVRAFLIVKTTLAYEKLSTP